MLVGTPLVALVGAVAGDDEVLGVLPGEDLLAVEPGGAATVGAGAGGPVGGAEPAELPVDPRGVGGHADRPECAEWRKRRERADD